MSHETIISIYAPRAAVFHHVCGRVDRL